MILNDLMLFSIGLILSVFGLMFLQSIFFFSSDFELSDAVTELGFSLFDCYDVKFRICGCFPV